MESQGTLSSQNNLEKERKEELGKEELGYILHFLISKLQSHSIEYYGVSIKRDRHWNRIEKRRNKPSIYVHIIFGKGTKTIQWGKISLLSKWCWESWISPYKWQKLDTYTIYKNQLRKQIQEVNVRTIKFLGEKWQNPHDIRFGNDFLDMTLKAPATREKISWTISKFKTVHEKTIRLKRQSMEWEKISAYLISN